MAVMWLIFVASWLIGGVSFPAMFLDAEDRALLKKAVNLRVKDADGNPADGLEEGWLRLKAPGRFWHDLKNITHEWFKLNPKVAYKGSGFVVLLLLILVVLT